MHELDRVMEMLAAKYPHIFMKLLFSDSPEVRFLAVEDTTINIPEKRLKNCPWICWELNNYPT